MNAGTSPNIGLQRTPACGLTAEAGSFGGRFIALVVFALISIGRGSVAFAEDPFATSAMGNVDGKPWQSQIFLADLKSIPKWNPNRQSVPPLSTGRALDIAKRKMAKLFPATTNWEVERVDLAWVWTQEHWYYEVMFSRYPAVMTNEEVPSFSILVLMNGKVIEPKPVYERR